jgi:hypothetical protein
MRYALPPLSQRCHVPMPSASRSASIGPSGANSTEQPLHLLQSPSAAARRLHPKRIELRDHLPLSQTAQLKPLEHTP